MKYISCKRSAYGGISVRNEGVNSTNNAYFFIEGYARRADPYDPELRAELTVSFFNFNPNENNQPVAPNYFVVATDYDNYAVVYNNINPEFELLWILTRQAFPDSNLIENVKAEIEALNIDISSLIEQDHSTCSSLPPL